MIVQITKKTNEEGKVSTELIVAVTDPKTETAKEVIKAYRDAEFYLCLPEVRTVRE